MFIFVHDRITIMGGHGVGVVPNASDVHAKVRETKSNGDTATVRLFIVEAQDYEKMPNFVADKTGKELDIVVSKADLSYFQRGKDVNILVSMIGDEKGQSYTARIKP
jgi:hypothetical protein